jgi:hypothetical protein
MKKTIELPVLSAEEQRRLVEIKMCVLIEHIFKTLGDRLTTYELIEVLCSASSTSVNLIKGVIANIRAANSTVSPDKGEIAVMFYRDNYPVSKICRIIDISPNTVYNYIEAYCRIKDREFLPKIKAEYYTQVEAFTKLLGELIYDEHRI